MTQLGIRNWRGMYALFRKEVTRFIKVTVQTVLAPVVTVLLYLLVFAHVLEEHVEVYQNVSYTTFLVPGLIMMAVIQNAFANSSSSLIQSKMNGNIVFVLLAPLSSFEFYLAFVAAAIVRGVLVGLCVFVVAVLLVDLPVHNIFMVMVFATLCSAALGAMGLVAGIWAETYDQLAGFQNFIILPLSFLSGVFYSIHSLPEFWGGVSGMNPFFYMIDGFRYGFFGVSDVSPWLALLVTLGFFAVVTGICLILLYTGYRIRE